ncbi:MD-2-related lipid-recognition protein-like [Hyposmocoma kahamanoa]|uniref:MD-2-related lipid-recognition protein-like n=1 Tax=Hyposmocoma kahamanoa TaxID=1477025 RepID=UPI000E6D7113|nr:MD-2-related lipid-recognition protein-like [Hyposmocoma kahamanoa]
MYKFVFILIVAFANAENLNKKFCIGEDNTKCSIHSVILDPCPEGPAFCTLKRNKQYTITVDLTPQFSAKTLKLALFADDTNKGLFDKTVKIPMEACDVLTCPMEANVRRLFDVDFVLGKTLGTEKFPLKVKLWNEDDDSQYCCFTFSVKMFK